MDNSVRNNSPDVTQYHEGVAGMPGTMIPRAGHEGSSQGFNANNPNKVVVDPDQKGGGFELDLDALTDTKKKFNSAAVRAGVMSDPAQFYQGLAAAQKKPTPPIQKETNMHTDPSGHPKETVKPLQPLPPLPPVNPQPSQSAATEDLTGKLQELLAVEKARAQETADEQEDIFARKQAEAEAARVEPIYYDGGHYPPPLQNSFPPSPVQMASQVQQLMAGMTQQRETINALVALHASNERAEKSAECEDIVVEEAAKEPEPEPELYPPHGIPFLEGAKPQRPQYETYFEMPKMGTMAARYHAVVEGNDCLALIYDTRFEDGFQYLPPSLGEERISVSVPKLNKTPYTCSSLGLHWTLGCMDVVILIKHSEGE